MTIAHTGYTCSFQRRLATKRKERAQNKIHWSGCNGEMGKLHWLMGELSILRPRKWAVGVRQGKDGG